MCQGVSKGTLLFMVDSNSIDCLEIIFNRIIHFWFKLEVINMISPQCYRLTLIHLFLPLMSEMEIFIYFDQIDEEQFSYTRLNFSSVFTVAETG